MQSRAWGGSNLQVSQAQGNRPLLRAFPRLFDASTYLVRKKSSRKLDIDSTHIDSTRRCIKGETPPPPNDNQNRDSVPSEVGCTRCHKSKGQEKHAMVTPPIPLQTHHHQQQQNCRQQARKPSKERYGNYVHTPLKQSPAAARRRLLWWPCRPAPEEFSRKLPSRP